MSDGATGGGVTPPARVAGPRTPAVWSVAGPVTVIRHGETAFRVYSSPQPVHSASVLRVFSDPGWLVIPETTTAGSVRRFKRMELNKALQHAGALVSALLRVDMKRKFTASQRYVMGRNACPAKIPCTDVGCPRASEVPTGTHYHLCMGAPDGGYTVWCSDHVASTEAFRRPGDAFWSMDDSGGGAPEVRGD